MPLKLTPYLEALQAPEGSLLPEAVLGDASLPFKPLGGKENFGYSNDDFWFRFELENSGSEAVDLLLELAYPTIDYATLYSASGGAGSGIALGDQSPFSNRGVKHRNSVWSLRAEPGMAETYYLKARSAGSVEIPLFLWDPTDFHNADHDRQLVYGIFFGLVLIMGIYNFFIYLSTKDVSYLAYILFIVGISSLLATFRGLSYEYFWPDSAFMANLALPFTIAVSCAGGTYFTMLFLKSSENSPKVHRVLQAYLAWNCLLIPLSLAIPYGIVIQIAVGTAMTLAFALVISGIMGILSHYRPARFYTAGWFFFLLSSALTSLRAFGVIGISFITEFGMEIGVMVEIVLLSLSLADKLAIMQRDREQEQIDMLVDQKRLTDAFARFLPSEFLAILEKGSVKELSLGDHTLKEMCVLFSDIRSFTSISEKMSPEATFRFINSYLGRMSPIVRQNGGFVDKYIGDAIMALFACHPAEALKAAIQMQREVDAYNEGRAKAGYPPIAIGIGLHKGKLSLGTIGEARRMETTVISDAVNVASRLESLTKKYGAKILLSGPFFKAASESLSFESRFLGRIRVKGKKAPIAVYEVLDCYAGEELELKRSNGKLLLEAYIHIAKKEYREAIARLQQGERRIEDRAITRLIQKLAKTVRKQEEMLL
jgi:adenylate cyclase